MVTKRVYAFGVCANHITVWPVVDFFPKVQHILCWPILLRFPALCPPLHIIHLPVRKLYLTVGDTLEMLLNISYLRHPLVVCQEAQSKQVWIMLTAAH
jgi:hypothetical protein